MMHIAFCCDNRYFSYCATVIASVIENNKDESLSFYVLCSDAADENEKLIAKWVESLDGNYSICFYHIDEQKFRDFSVEHAYVTIATYFRLALPDLLPNIDKVLYLDCDVIVNGSLRELWNTNIRNHAMAGVLDRHSGSIRLYNRLGYPFQYEYVNAGVLLINLKKWREDNLFSKALILAKQKPLHLKNHDQDILNIIYYNQKKILDFKYNLLEYYLYVEEWLYIDRKYYPQIIEACKSPVIIHFCLPVKPWHYECINPFKSLYYKYKALTPWPEVNLIHRNEKLSSKQKLKKLLGKLRLYHIESKPSLRKDINVIEEPDNVLF